MQTETKNEIVSKVDSFNGINIYRIETGIFKTGSVNIFFHDNLNEKNVTKNALLPAVLRRGCEGLPTLQDIALKLEQLYGSVFDCSVAKKGERHVIHFYIEHISDKYASKEDELFKNSFNLLLDIIYKPVLENGVFKKEYVDQEKENLKRLIQSRVNDKVNYAIDRCFEEMCKEEPFSIYEYGRIEDLEDINEENLYEHYKMIIENHPMDVFITGDTDETLIYDAVEKLKSLKRNNISELDKSIVTQAGTEVKEITEKMNVNQAKLSIGFRTGISSDDEDYYSLLVYNGILGGGMHSKLFQNVREKESLAYYIFSRLEKFKGLMIVSCGIDFNNKEKTINIIKEQMDEIKKGNISDYEYDSTIKSIETGMKSLRDSQIRMVDFYLSQTIAGTNDYIDTIIEKCKKVTKEDVIKIANKVSLDTVYFLTAN